jgi:hypothetical protein
MRRFAIVAATVLALGSISKAESIDFQKLGFASETEMQNYFNVVDVKVTQAPVQIRHFNSQTPVDPAVGLGTGIIDTLGPILMDPSGIGGWIAFGKKAWEIIVANRPVVDVQTTTISVLPNDKAAWPQMSGWRGPVGTAYRFQAVNGFGSVVVDHKYLVSYDYGGQWNGAGSYLANVTIIPTRVEVSWGYNLNSSVEVGQVLNTGTVASPVPAVDLHLKYRTKTLMTDLQGVEGFYVKGDGSLQHYSN